MSREKVYTDVGHNDEDDVLWILIDMDLQYCRCGGMTHMWAFDLTRAQLDKHWRGRYEVSTGLCSVAPPASWPSTRQLPSAVRDTLSAHFKVSDFEFFHHGYQRISPNPGRR